MKDFETSCIQASGSAPTHNSSSAVYIIGGSSGNQWLETVDIFFPPENNLKPAFPMRTPRPFPAAIAFDKCVYVLGGGHESSWFDIGDLAPAIMSLPLVRLSPSGLVSLLLFVAYLAAIINAEIQHYSFVIEPTTVTRLCKKSTYVTVNGQLPGPTILVHDGDTVIVKTYNRAKYNATLHWHGVKQLRTGWADGPAYVTQCPIQPGGNFTQKFTITGQQGTLWWHAHFSWLRSTVHGAIVILPKRGSLYPSPKPFAEIPIIIGEWWSSDHPISLINQAVLTGGAPNLSDAFTINGQPGDLYHCSRSVVKEFSYLKERVDEIDDEKFVFKYTLIEGGPLGIKLSALNFEIKLIPREEGGCVVVRTSNYETLPGAVMDEGKAKEVEENTNATYQKFEQYLLSNPNLYC